MHFSKNKTKKKNTVQVLYCLRMNALPILSFFLISVQLAICGKIPHMKEPCKYPEFTTLNGSCIDPVTYCESIGDKNSVFNEEYKKCILPIGAECATQVNSPVACPPNGYCRENKTCECEDFFIPNGNFMCVRGMTHGSTCDLKEDILPKVCEETEGFTCQNGTCLCQEGRFWSEAAESCVKNVCEERGEDYQFFYDKESKQCQLEIGTERGYYLLRYLRDNLIHCPANSHIEEWEVSWETRVGPPAGRCICDPGFHRSPNRRVCHENKLQGGTCDTVNGDSCDPSIGLSCVRGHCECRTGATWDPYDDLCYSKQECKKRDPESYFDRTAMKCFKRIGKTCKVDLNSKVKCSPNSSCRSRNSTQECECDPGFWPRFKGEGCVKEKLYGEDCSSFAKKGSLKGGPCSPVFKLSCLKKGPRFSTCGCQGTEIWDKKSQVCKLKEGQRCDLQMTYAMDCVEDSICKIRDEDGKSYCTCKPNYTRNFTGKCVASTVAIPHHKCHFTSDCYLDRNLLNKS